MDKGLKSVKTLTANQIAKKHGLPLAVITKKIAAGVKVEKEHTKSTKEANEIARDHLGERPDYYERLHKMEKSPVVKENTTVTTGIGGLGFNTGTPAVDADNQYIDTNSMSYEDWNGAILKMIRDKHHNHLIDMGFTSYSPNDIQNASNRIVKEAKHPLQANFDKYRKGELNELGEYDNKGGTVGAEGLTDAPPKKAVKEQGYGIRSYTEKPLVEKKPTPDAMPTGADRGIYEGWALIGNPYDRFGDVNRKAKFYGKKPKATTTKNDEKDDTYKGSKQGGKVKFAKPVKEEQIDEISAELVGKVSNARFWQRKAPSKTLSNAVKKKFIESGKKKEKEEVKEYWTPFLTPHHKHSARLNKEKSNKPDIIVDPGGKKGQTVYENLKEETTMDTKELINEALDCVLEDNLSEMKDNLMQALQEKTIEKLEERKKEIAANYFAE